MSRAVTILYGTETFTAEGFAERTGEALEALDYDVSVTDLEDFDPEDISSVQTLLLVTSTYGNGDPPANAEPLFDHLMADTAPRLPHLRFSVCGLGDMTYPRFCQCGKDFDRRLAELGGHRLAARTDCDVDVEPSWEAWLEAVQSGLEALSWDLDALPSAPAAAPSQEVASAATATPAGDGAQEEGVNEPDVPEPVRPAESDPLVSAASALHLRCGPPSNPEAPHARRRNPVALKVTVNQPLTGAGATREVRHLELALGESGLTYEAGDSIGLFAPNDPDLVDAILAASGADPATPVELKDTTTTLRDAMLTRLDVHVAEARLASAIQAAGGTALEPDGTADVHVLDAIRAGGVPLDGPTLAACLRRQAPRLYSVASSPTVHPDHVHLVASVVSYEAYGRTRMGVATGWMAERLPEGATVRAYLQPLDTFRLADSQTDIIMIGPGTGIAPFRAFLQHRSVRRATGRSWLFFGSRNRATDYLYHDEIEAWRNRGILTRLDLAFSRDTPEKVYVQDQMRKQSKALWTWLSGGAVVYVCGDAKAMAPDVHRTLQEVAQTEGGMTKEDARAWIRDLAQSGRYMRDVY